MESQQSSNYDQLLDEAIEWIGKLNAGILSAEENQVFIDWVNSSTEHRRAYQEMSAVWQLTEGVQSIPEFCKETEEILQRSVKNRSKRTSWMAAAASIVVAFGLLLTQLSPDPASSNKTRTLASSVGEIKSVDLEDGSSVVLNTNTSIEITFSKKERFLKLLKGEALFVVKSDPKWPFIVDTGDSYVRAIGTAFNIKRSTSNTVITVTEGVVQIDKQDVHAASLEAIKDNRVIISKQSDMLVENADIESELAWMNSQLIYIDTPIESVINDLSAYFKKPLSLNDSSLKELTVNGTLNVDDPEQALATLLAGFNLITIENRGQREIIRE